MEKLKMLFAAAAAMVLAFVGASASAAEIKLTMTSWDSLKNAVKNASAGDVISVTPIEGKYGEGEYYTAESTITIGKSLTIQSANSSKPLKIYNGTTRLPVFDILSGADEVKLDKIFFTGSNVSTPTKPQCGTIVSAANTLRLSYCSFDGCTASISDAYYSYAGAVVASGSLLRMNDCLFRNCRVIKHVTDKISLQYKHCAGAVSTTAKETIVNYCSFIDNGVEGFKSAGGFMENATPAAIVAGDLVTPTSDLPPVLTISRSTFSGNRGASAVFAANYGLRIISSTFVQNGPAEDNPGYGGRAVRFWHPDKYADSYEDTGCIAIANSVFLGNMENGQYVDITYSKWPNEVKCKISRSLFSVGSSIGHWPTDDCRYLTAAESAVWYEFFLNGSKVTGVAPTVTPIQGVDHYAYPLSHLGYEGNDQYGNYWRTYPLYYNWGDTTPYVYGENGDPTKCLWNGFETKPASTPAIRADGVDRQSCYRSEGGNKKYLPSCGSAASHPSVVKFQKNKTGDAVYETVTAMWNYEKVTMPENDHEETGYMFKRWECNGKTYEPGEVVDVKDLSTQYFGEYRPDETIVVAPVYEAKGYRVYFQTQENTNVVLSSYITAMYYQSVTIRAPKDSVYDGYTVQGWAKTKERAAAGQIDFLDGASILYVTDVGMNLYWVNRKPNTATYEFRQDTVSGNKFSMEVTTDGAEMVPTCPFVRPGYTFKCWFTGTDENRVEYYPGEGFGKVAVDGSTVTLYGDWEKVSDFAIRYSANGGSGTMTSQTIRAMDGDLRLKTAAQLGFTKTDCTLVGWSKDPYCTLQDWFYKPGDSA